MFDTAVRDRIFKTVILVFLFFSIVIQILISTWFYDKLRTLENQLSLYPVNKPVEVDLKVTIPELAEIDRKIDGLTQRLDTELKTQEALAAPKQRAKSEPKSQPASKKNKTRKANKVDIVEKVTN
jgi:hypothetical protein